VDGLNKFDGDARFMRRAIALAREGDRRPGANPIGCVIVLDGEIVGEGYNEVDGYGSARSTVALAMMEDDRPAGRAGTFLRSGRQTFRRIGS
jgi:pyrimidine deaminase RibD-like protein